VIWSSGTVDIHTDVSANNFYIATEGSGLTITSLNETPPVIPIEPSLKQNYPNPFNPRTSIQYTLNNLLFVSFKVYDVLGNEISILVNEEKPAGNYEIDFNGSDLSSGVYFYRMQAGSFSDTKKFTLMK
jgi:hypothetical protein